MKFCQEYEYNMQHKYVLTDLEVTVVDTVVAGVVMVLATVVDLAVGLVILVLIVAVLIEDGKPYFLLCFFAKY